MKNPLEQHGRAELTERWNWRRFSGGRIATEHLRLLADNGCWTHREVTEVVIAQKHSAKLWQPVWGAPWKRV